MNIVCQRTTLDGHIIDEIELSYHSDITYFFIASFFSSRALLTLTKHPVDILIGFQALKNQLYDILCSNIHLNFRLWGLDAHRGPGNMVQAMFALFVSLFAQCRGRTALENIL